MWQYKICAGHREIIYWLNELGIDVLSVRILDIGGDPKEYILIYYND